MEATEFGEPFRYWIIRDLVDAETLAEARASIPSAADPNWIRYDNELERRKWAMEKCDSMPSAWKRLLSLLSSPPMIANFKNLTGIRELVDVRCDRGAGLHVMFGGGHLSPHLDYALHPSGMERRLNLILFWGIDWPYFAGGGLMFCTPNGDPAKVIEPKAGEAVLWESSDLAYHGVQPLHAASPPRVTAAAYYLALPRTGVTRRRAMFLPMREK